MADPDRLNSAVGGLLVLFARGLLLWVVVPVAACGWVFVASRLRQRGVTFGQFLGWVDLNLIATLQRTIFRPFVRQPAERVPVVEMHRVTHRLRVIDPV